jgi:AraC family transcriptional regulator of adaptative response / DNA-3-methyladenine glycosylase II
MTPEAYRALDGNREFSLLLPRGYRANEILAYQARDPEGSRTHQDNRIWKALGTSDGPVILELALSSGQVAVRIHPQRSIGRGSMAGLHRDAMSILGLINNVSEFERRHATPAAPRLGLRVPSFQRVSKPCAGLSLASR